jgi:hypothetical protein
MVKKAKGIKVVWTLSQRGGYSIRLKWLAGGRFQSRPVQMVPSGAMVMCWAMSRQPFC